MGSGHITLKISPLASLMIDTHHADQGSGIRIGSLNPDEASMVDGFVIQDENSPVIIQVRWKNATTEKESLRTTSPAGIAAEPNLVPYRVPMAGDTNSGDRLTQLLTTEFLKIKQKSIDDGRIQACSEHLQDLSAKEIDVLILMIEGRSCKEIATRLRIGLATVAKHRVRILKKLEVRDTVELVQVLLAAFDDAHSLSNRSNGSQNIG